MTFLDSLLNSHPEDPAFIDGVRIPYRETHNISFLSLHQAEAENAHLAT
jgi:hypothetical protein